jgi:hypothetical protein
LTVKVPLPVVDRKPLNNTRPGRCELVTVPLMVNVPLPAVEWSPKTKPPPSALAVPPLMVKVVLIPAVAFPPVKLANCIPPAPASNTKLWVIPELLVMPAPMTFNGPFTSVLMVNALATGLNTISVIVVFADTETPVVPDVAKVATSALALGTVAGVQFVAVFQSPDPGAASQVALPA